ncbi:MAG: J domain-containing protein [Myxococcota bacterium]
MAEDKPTPPSWTRIGSKLAGRMGRSAKRGLNTLLDVVDDFEKRGGLSGLINDTLDDASGRALTGSTRSGEKSLIQYYANLEVPYGADLATVKKSYRRLLRKYHPDKHSGDPEREQLATELTQELTRAYTAVVKHLEATGRA